MTRLRYGTLAGVAGSALAIYNWWRSRPDYVARQMSLAGHSDITRQMHMGTTTTPAGGAVV